MAQKDLDALLSAIKAEALELESNAQFSHSPKFVDISDQIELIAVEYSDTVEMCTTYDVAELLEADDQLFVMNLFRAILQREADSGGLSSYLGRLRSGEDKAEILLSILCSPEAALKDVEVFDGPWVKLDRLTSNRIGRRLWLYSWKIRQKFFRVKQQQQQQRRLQSKAFRKRIASVTALIREVLNALNVGVKEQAQSIARLNQDNQDMRKQMANLQYRLAYLNQHLSLTSAGQHETGTAVPKQYTNADIDAFYVAFEDACRGTREEIEAKLRRWLDCLPTTNMHSKRVLDIGCGRGEWLALLQEAGFSAQGLDVNPIMVASCCEQGLVAEVKDALFWLEQQPDESLTAITAFHVIEHIPFELLLRWTTEARRVLEKGGVLIYETPNPENLLVGSHTFYHDPTHRNPITPTLLEFLASYTGFEESRIIRLHPYPESAKVKGIDPLTERVNGHLCGEQDFALLATKV